MSDDPKTATHLEPNDLLSLVRLGKLQAELRVIEMSAKPLVVKAQAIARAAQRPAWRTLELDPATGRYDAAATPSTDPFSMLALAIPMTLLFLAAEVICHLHDKRKAKRLAAELVAST